MARVHLKSLILRCPAPAGAPLGGPNPLSTLLCQLHSAPHIIHDHTLAYSFLCVASALPLLHVPRFPFHDSTGFENPCISIGKPYIFESKGNHVYAHFPFGSTGAEREHIRGASWDPLIIKEHRCNLLIWCLHAIFRQSKNPHVIH